MESDLGTEYENTMNEIYDTYSSLTQPMKEFILKKYPMKEGENEKAFAATAKARVCDNIRYLLPTATLTNVGVTMNARALEHAIVKLLSNPLEEMNDIGKEMKVEALKITPTLIKFASEDEYLKATIPALEKQSAELLPEMPVAVPAVEIVSYDADAEDKLVAALLYKTSNLPYKQIMAKVKTFNNEQKEKVIDESLSRRADFDQPIRELEHIYYTFDILMDYGAFRDIQRHRICTQTNQEVTVINGYEIPPEIIEAGFEDRYRKTMEKAVALYNKIIEKFPKEAQYVVPLGFRKRTLFTWNLRELHHFIPLRSGSKGHVSYRRVAQACWHKLNEIQPLLAKYIRVNMEEGSSSWASTMFNPEFNYMPKKQI